MSSTWYDFFFGPLSKSWCSYYLVCEMFALGMVFFLVAGAALKLFSGRGRGMSSVDFGLLSAGVVNGLLGYLSMRLMHTMCVGGMQ